MEQISQSFLNFIDAYGYFAVAVLMAMENACIPIPSELILGFSGYLIFAERMTFTGAMTAGMIGGNQVLVGDGKDMTLVGLLLPSDDRS